MAVKIKIKGIKGEFSPSEVRNIYIELKELFDPSPTITWSTSDLKKYYVNAQGEVEEKPHVSHWLTKEDKVPRRNRR